MSAIPLSVQSIHSFVAPKPKPKPQASTEIVLVSWAMAAEWLKKNKNYRKKVKPKHVAMFRRIFSEGLYQFDGSPIRFSVTGDLVDGQHRLAGLAESKAGPEWFLVVRGIESDRTIDTNSVTRTINDHLDNRGEKNICALRGALSLLWCFENGASFSVSGSMAGSSEELLNLLGANPSIRESVRKCTHVEYGVPSHVSTLHYLISRSNVELADKFVADLSTTANKGVDDPVRRFQDRMTKEKISKGKLPKWEKLALLIKTWNMWLAGESCRSLVYRSSGPAKEDFPSVTFPGS